MFYLVIKQILTIGNHLHSKMLYQRLRYGDASRNGVPNAAARSFPKYHKLLLLASLNPNLPIQIPNDFFTIHLTWCLSKWFFVFIIQYTMYMSIWKLIWWLTDFFLLKHLSYWIYRIISFFIFQLKIYFFFTNICYT